MSGLFRKKCRKWGIHWPSGTAAGASGSDGRNETPIVRDLRPFEQRGEVNTHDILPMGIRLRQPQLLADEPAEGVPNFVVPWNWGFSSVVGIEIDVVPTSMPIETATRILEFSNEGRSLHT